MESPLRGRVPAGTQLIETFGWTPKAGFARLDLHLARMERSAQALGLAYDEARALYEIKAEGDSPLRCRLTLGEEGFAFTSTPLVSVPTPWRIAIAPDRLASDDPWLAHKSTQRALYDKARANLPNGVDELLFLNEDGHLCEGTITNLFVADGRSVLTPALSCGVLPGILRQSMIEAGKAQEARLTPDDLKSATKIFMGNALRGLIPAQLVD